MTKMVAVQEGVPWRAKCPMIGFAVSLLLFGSNGIVASAIPLSSYQIVYLRTGLGSLLLGVILLAARRHLSVLEHPRQFACVVASGVFMGVSWLFLYRDIRTLLTSRSNVTP